MSIRVFESIFLAMSGIFLFFVSCVYRILFTIQEPPSVYPPLILSACVLVLILGVAHYYHSRSVFDYPRRVRYGDVTRILKSTKLIWLYRRGNKLIYREFKDKDGVSESYIIYTWPNFLSASHCSMDWIGDTMHNMDTCEFLCEVRKITANPLFISLYSYPGSGPKLVHNIASVFKDKTKLCDIFGDDVYNVLLTVAHLEQVVLN